jgi:probable HAF family extracellular repeat protein
MQNLMLVAILSAGLGFGFSSHVFAQETHSYIVDLNSKAVTDLGTLGGDAINAAGQVAGAYITLAGEDHAIITGPNGGGITDLGTLAGVYSYATGINATGQAVGLSYTATGAHVFITRPNGVGMTDIGTLGGNYSYATGVNDAGQVVGYSFDQQRLA